MSLLNDALKRAQEAQRPNISPSVASLRSIEARHPERPAFGRLLAIIILVLLAATVVFLGLAKTGRLAKKIAVATPVVSQAQPVQPAPAPAPLIVAAPVAVAPKPAAAVAAPTLVPAVDPAPKPAAKVAVAALPPLVLPDTLVVQGIGYDPVRAWAIVSGRTVHVGDTVKGFQVVQISRDSVTFGTNGQTSQLFVGQ